jgi:flagellar biosynthesis/type III secretory pathway protein FliH
MKRFLIVPALGVAALALATPGFAQQPSRFHGAVRTSYADDARQPYYESRRAAYDNGYREGLRDGQQDARRRNPGRYQDNRAWQRADKGYNRAFGDLERYRQQFRAGFADGYRAGFSGYQQGNTRYRNGRAIPRQDPYRYPGGYGTSYPDRNSRYPEPYYGDRGPYGAGRYGYHPAHANGVNDGLEKGREDARKRRSFDPLRHEWYREGERHYRREYGPKQQYANLYREGFKEGYDRGYAELAYFR